MNSLGNFILRVLSFISLRCDGHVPGDLSDAALTADDRGVINAIGEALQRAPRDFAEAAIGKPETIVAQDWRTLAQSVALLQEVVRIGNTYVQKVRCSPMVTKNACGLTNMAMRQIASTAAGVDPVQRDRAFALAFVVVEVVAVAMVRGMPRFGHALATQLGLPLAALPHHLMAEEAASGAGAAFIDHACHRVQSRHKLNVGRVKPLFHHLGRTIRKRVVQWAWLAADTAQE